MRTIALAAMALGLAGGVQAQTLFSTDFDLITSQGVQSGTFYQVGTFDYATVTGDADAGDYSGDRVVRLPNSTVNSSLTLYFTLATDATSFDFSFWAASNASVGVDTGVVLTLLGPSGSQVMDLDGLGPVTGPNANPDGMEHSGTFFGDVAGAYSLTFSNYATNDGMRIDDVSINAMTAAVPEPGTYAMMALGLAVLGGAAARRRRG